jgi:uncharacterized protein
MSFLLDVNVLLAICWEEMEAHETARAWFSAHHTKGWATCSLTEAAFVRIAMNPKVFPDAANFREALAVLAALRTTPGHRFLEQGTPLTESDFPARTVRGHKQVVDATLLALARKHKAQLVTFDKGIASIASTTEWKKRLVLLG